MMYDMTTGIIIVFVLGYVMIALESATKINKAATSLLMCSLVLALYAMSGISVEELNHVIESDLGEASSTLFLLMGAMAIVYVVDKHEGFNFVKQLLHSKSKRSLLWKVTSITFILSSVLDNLTTSIVMMMILHKLVENREDRLWYASSIIIAANAAGAFSPIGDVTTIMLWNSHAISAFGIIKGVMLSSIVSVVLPVLFIQRHLSGTLCLSAEEGQGNSHIAKNRRITILVLGVGGLCSVPVFHSITGLPAYVGILLVLGILWFTTEIMYRGKSEEDSTAHHVAPMLKDIDLPTILFFLGVLMSVSVLSNIGIMTKLGDWFNNTIGNYYLITSSIGVLSALVDNVALVAAAMKMYTIDATSVALATDGTFWQMLAFCAGTGGSLLIIGSATGVVVMGMEKISFSWYLKHITPIVLLGYLAGIFVYCIG